MSPERVAVVTGSAADLAPVLATQRAITVVPLTVTLDGRDHLDGVDITADEVYAMLAASSGGATTSQPSPGRFAEVYERLLADHDRVVSLHISASLSGTHEAAVQGAAMVAPDRVRVVDTGMVSMPLALLTLAASGLAARGEPAGAIVDRVHAIRERIRVYFMVATLEYLRRGGPVGRATAAVVCG